MKEILEYEGLGKVVFRRESRIRRISLRITGGQVSVSAPLFISIKEMTQFLEQHREWVEDRLSLQKNRLKIYDENVNFYSSVFRLKIESHDKSNFVAQLVRTQGLLLIRYPKTEDIHSENSQSIVKKYIMNALTIEAKKLLPERLRQLANQHDFKYTVCQVRKMETRWGSCSSKGAIHLSASILLLPEHLQDFVMLHELCHTKEMNHGVAFHRLMNEVTHGKEKKMIAEIRKYSARL